MKNNRNIIFTTPNITVALNKVEYISEIMMLNDTETYIKIMKNPINALTRRTRELCIKRKKNSLRIIL